jgi:ferredoxin
VAVYQVRLLNPTLNLDRTIAVPDDQYILDMATEAGIRLPSGCLQGECSICLARIIDGQIDQHEQNFLKPTEVDAGYTVTCVAYPRSDCVLETHQEQVLYKNALYFNTPQIS